jgi:hypothetical protein
MIIFPRVGRHVFAAPSDQPHASFLQQSRGIICRDLTFVAKQVCAGRQNKGQFVQRREIKKVRFPERITDRHTLGIDNQMQPETKELLSPLRTNFPSVVLAGTQYPPHNLPFNMPKNCYNALIKLKLKMRSGCLLKIWQSGRVLTSP